MYVLLREYPTDFRPRREGSGRGKPKSLAEHGKPVAVHLLHVKSPLFRTFVGDCIRERAAHNRFYPRTASPEELALEVEISWAAKF